MSRLIWHQAVLQNMFDSVIAVDTRQRIMLMNPAAERLLGYTIKEIQGQDFSEILTLENSEYRNEIRQSLQTVLETGQHEIFTSQTEFIQQTKLNSKNGGNIAPLYEHPGKIMGALFVFYNQNQYLNPGLCSEDLEKFIVRSPVAIALFDRNMRYLATSRRWIEDYRLEDDNLLGRSHYEVFPEIPNHWKVTHQQCLAGSILRNEELFPREHGEAHWINWVIQPWYESRNSIGGMVVLTEDITDRKHLEQENQDLLEQLVAAQKIESLGRLAGGIAHDFNNMLNVIQGHVGLALLDIDTDHPLHQHLTEIRDAAERSTDLTQQLLSFSSREESEPRLIELNQSIEGMMGILKRLIAEEIEFVWEPESEGCIVKMDPSQIDQILANLCVNASDAISGIGTITLKTVNREFDHEFCKAHPDYLPGHFVMLSVSDTGPGIDPATQARIFEPFFTTKPQGKGTGLGLSTVSGIVNQNQGFIRVENQPGCGSTFQIFLPCRRDGKPLPYLEPAVRAPVGTNEMILLIDDEPMLAKISREILLSLGYRVIIATSPREAIQMMLDFKGTVNLLITDVVMPEMNGQELYHALQKLQPNLNVLYMSGYTLHIMAEQGITSEENSFLKKPFSRNELAVKVRQVLQQSRAS